MYVPQMQRGNPVWTGAAREGEPQGGSGRRCRVNGVSLKARIPGMEGSAWSAKPMDSDPSLSRPGSSALRGSSVVQITAVRADPFSEHPIGPALVEKDDGHEDGGHNGHDFKGVGAR